MVEYLRTNYRVTGGKGSPNALTSVIVQTSGPAISCAGYLFGSTGYGIPSAIWAYPMSELGACGSVRGDGDDSVLQIYGFGPGSVSGSVYFVSVLLQHPASGGGVTFSMANAVDAYDTATPSTSVSLRILLTMVIGTV